MQTKKITKCFRFVNENLTSHQDGVTKWEVGKWNKITGKLVPCESGLHASLTPLESLNNVYGDRWFMTEARGEIVKKENKFCANEMRIVREIPIEVIKRFALFCAKDCLINYEKEYPNDKRVSDCIKATEDYLDGKITLDELSAARSAAWSAWSAWSAESAARSARSAAWSAAWSAESAARSARSAESAAWSARSAAWSAAWSAESAARSARSAAEKRQNKELNRLIKEYAK